MKFEQETHAAREAALAAGVLLRQRFTQAKEVLFEDRRDIKLQADRDSEALILERLGSFGYPVLAEESGASGALADDALCWVVDPLDGTANFSRALPYCCVSIALCRGDVPQLGVIHDFNNGEMFVGVPGEGAWLNDAPMRVSAVRDAAKAVLMTGFPAGDYESDYFARWFETAQRFKKVRLMGAAALMIAYVACGRADAYGENDTYLWDVAAGAALVEAAGGDVRMIKSARREWGYEVRCAASAELWGMR